jgi:hypothetical protein
MRIAPVVIPFVISLGLAACTASDSGCGRFDSDCNADYQADMAADNAEASAVDASDVEEPAFDGCTDDCSGHEEGFQWAQNNDVTDSSECSGNSNSFIEGCEAFAEARQEQAQEEAMDDVVEDDE